MYIYHCSKRLQKWLPLIDNATAEAFRGIADVLSSALPVTVTHVLLIRVTPACPQSAQMWPCDVTWQMYAYF